MQDRRYIELQTLGASFFTTKVEFESAMELLDEEGQQKVIDELFEI